jgi:glycosyltransferase involved in cell wall biosynthesis
MKQQRRIIVSVTNDLFTDQRVHKVCLFLHENNFNVTLVGRLLPNSVKELDRPYTTKRMRLWFHKGPLFYANYSIRLFFFLLFRKSDVLLSNDLDTLLASFLAHKCKLKSELVYDSHELFTEVPELINRPKVRAVWLRIERWIFPKLTKVYTVNASIAKCYREKYKVEVKVVRNVSPKWAKNEVQSKEELGIPTDKKIAILQGAGINIDRGAEEAVEAMQFVEGVVFIIVGSGDVIPQLKEMVLELRLQEKVLFFDKKPYHELMEYTYHADIGLTLDKATNQNYKLSLPNKVFDYIHAATPILASGINEVTRIVEKHEVGEIIFSHDPVDIAQAINGMLFDEEKLSRYKENCQKAAAIENWENECEVLKKLFINS